jgi:hypothetical protein
MGDEAGRGGRVGEGVADACVEGAGDEGKVERGDVGVGDEDVGSGGEGADDGVCDVLVDVESAVDRVFPEDGDRRGLAGLEPADIAPQVMQPRI